MGLNVELKGENIAKMNLKLKDDTGDMWFNFLSNHGSEEADAKAEASLISPQGGSPLEIEVPSTSLNYLNEGTYSDLKEKEYSGSYEIFIGVPAEGKLAEAEVVFDKAHEALESRLNDGDAPEREAYNHAITEMGTAIHTTAAKKLTTATLSITVTFKDNSTETHEYRISPIEDFEEVYREFYSQDWETYTSQSEPQLMVLEQLS